MRRRLLRAGVYSFFSAVLPALFATPALAIEWVTIGDPGNPPDDEVVRCCLAGATGRLTNIGAVDYVYRIGLTEVTNTEYVEFLDAVAAADPNGLYSIRMNEDIVQSGSSGSFSYELVLGRENRPLGNIDVFDALRFANWLHNGQPVGPQDATTTEDGAYTLLGTNPLDYERNPGAAFFLPSEDEWYKAAYYDPDVGWYWEYPTGTDATMVSEFPPGDFNSGNYKAGPFPNPCDPATSPCDTTDVGAYLFAESPWGTMDQGGNLHEWIEETVLFGGQVINLARGGVWSRPNEEGASWYRVSAPPGCQGCFGVGLRIAAPEPGGVLPAAVAVALTAALARRRARLRRRSGAAWGSRGIAKTDRVSVG